MFWQIIDPEVERDEIDENYIAHLSYRKVKKHQYKYHPRNRETKEVYDWKAADISFIPLWMGLIGNDNKWVTNEAREIGIGPTLFLMT